MQILKDPKIGNEDRLNITYTTADSKSDVTVTGNENLSDEGIISALLAEKEKCRVVWWKTDLLTGNL